MYKKTDEELVREVQIGHIASYEDLVRRFEKKMINYAWRFVRNDEDAKDIVQQAFIDVYENIDAVDVSRSFSAYLYRTVKNGSISVIRKNKRTVPFDEINLHSQLSGIEDDILSQIDSSQVRQVIEKLEDKYKKVLTLYYFDDLSYEEIARKLSLPLNTVRTNLRRAKIRLRSLIHI